MFSDSKLCLVFSPISDHNIFFKNYNNLQALYISCHLPVSDIGHIALAASYSDSYSSDEDDVSPRERTQVCT